MITLIHYHNLKDWLLKAANLHKDRSKLVMVQRTVSKHGRTFQQHFWISPEDVRSTDKVLVGKHNLPKGHAQRPDNAISYKSTKPIDPAIKQKTHEFFGNFEKVEDCISHLKANGIYWDPPKDDLQPHVRAALNIMRAKMALNAAIHNGYTPPLPKGTSQQQSDAKNETSEQNAVNSSEDKVKPEPQQNTSNQQSAGNSKAKVNDFQLNFTSNQEFLDSLNKMGIIWKHSDHRGINLMRAKMAANKAVVNGMNLSEEFTKLNSQQEDTQTERKSAEQSEQESAEQPEKIEDKQSEQIPETATKDTQSEQKSAEQPKKRKSAKTTSKKRPEKTEETQPKQKSETTIEDKQTERKSAEQPEKTEQKSAKKTDKPDTKKIIQEYVDKHIDDEDWINNLIVEHEGMLSDPRIDTNLRDVIVDYLMKNESETLNQINEEKKQIEDQAKREEEQAKSEEEQAKLEAEHPDRNYNSSVARALGKSAYNYMRDSLDEIAEPYEELKTIWKAYEEDMRVGEERERTISHFDPSSKMIKLVGLSRMSSKNTEHSKSELRQLIFHEGSHHIDYHAGDMFTSPQNYNPNLYFSVEYNDGEFINALREDAKNLLKSYGLEENFREPIKQKIEKRKNDDPEWFEDQKQNIFWLNPNFKGDPVDWLVDDELSEDPRISKLNNDLCILDVNFANRSVLDILVGATNGDLVLSGFEGHSRNYWKESNSLIAYSSGYVIQRQWTGLSVEAFAELNEAIMSGDQDQVKSFQKYFPTACKVNKKMINELAKGGFKDEKDD